MGINILHLGIIGGGIGVAVFLIMAVSMFTTSEKHATTIEFKDIELDVKGMKFINKTNDGIYAEVTFSLHNPNPTTLILQTIEYKLFANGVKVAGSRIGEKLGGGFVDTSANLYYIIAGGNLDIHNKLFISKESVNEDLWKMIESNSKIVNWRVSGSYIITTPQREDKEYNFDKMISIIE